MHQIEKIEVDGFWDNYSFSVDLNPDVTFFIGVNGTGKTTLINLIAATLLADIPALEKLPFKKIDIYLSSNSSKDKAKISVKKMSSKTRRYRPVSYSIIDKRGQEKRFDLEEFQDRYLMRRPRQVYSRPHYFHRELAAEIQKLINVSWLSVHRTSLYGNII